MSSKPNLIKNYLYNLSYQLLAIIVPIVTTPYVSRVLGPSAFGDYSYTVSIVSYFGMVAMLGMVNYGQRTVAFYQSKLKERSVIFWEMTILRFAMVALVFAAYLALLLAKTKYQTLFLIQLFTVFSWAMDISWFFQGIEDFRTTVVRNSLVKLASLILIFACVKDVDDMPVYALIISGTAFLGNLTMWPFLKSKIVSCARKDLHPLRHLRGSLELFIPVLSIQIYTVLDQTMLGSMMGTTEVGYYAMTQKILHVESSLVASLTAVLMPRIASLLAQERKERAAMYYNRAVTFGVMLNLPLTVGTMLIAGNLIPVFLGENYLPSIRILQVLSLIFVTQGISQIAGSALIALEKQKYYTIAVTTGALVNFCCNLLLIPVLGAVGVAIASVFSELCVQIIMLRSIRPNFDNKALFGAYKRYFLPAVLMGALLAAEAYFLPVNLISLVVMGISAVAVYFIILYLRRDSLLMQLRSIRNAGVEYEEDQ